MGHANHSKYNFFRLTLLVIGAWLTFLPFESQAQFRAKANGIIDAMAVQSDGSTIISGAFTRVNGLVRFRITRLTPDGKIDRTFNRNGSGASDRVERILILKDGKILIEGDFIRVNGIERIGLALLNADGSLDMSFNANEVSPLSLIHI